MRQNLGTATSRPRDYSDKTYADSVGATGAAMASGTHAASSKATPVDADELFLADSAASFGPKKLTIANLKTVIAAFLVGAAPGTLDTLDEIAAALGDDPNFAATITALLATKASLTGTETLTGKTLTNPTITNYTETVAALGSVGATATLSLASGTVQTATLTASTLTTFTMPTPAAGKSFVLYLKQPAITGTATAAFTGVKWPGATAPVITPTQGRMDILSFYADGTNWYGSFAQNYTY